MTYMTYKLLKALLLLAPSVSHRTSKSPPTTNPHDLRVTVTSCYIFLRLGVYKRKENLYDRVSLAGRTNHNQLKEPT